MLNWMAIYRRILKLYGAKSQQDLGMALGVPVNFGKDGEEPVIPWPILELVVSEKRVSWDWLLTGKGEGGGDTVRRPAAEQSGAASPPRLETRELERVLLNPEEDAGGDSEDTGGGAVDTGRSKSGRVVRTLEDIKSRMQKEIERVEKLLEEQDS